MPRIVAKGDNLNELNANFAQQRLLEPVFLNSVPKCGTHLVRNIMRMHRGSIQVTSDPGTQTTFSMIF